MNSSGAITRAIMTDWSVIPSGKIGMLVCVSSCTRDLSVNKILIYTGDDRPDMKDLNRYIVRQQAAQWERLGLELGLERYHIAYISRDHPNESVICCGKMLQDWLDIDPSASWRKLEDGVRRIRLPTTSSAASTVSSDYTGIMFSL